MGLYYSQHARYLIFSSGYHYLFQEAAIMKVLAVSLRVPADAILLEERAKKTHENVKLLKGILITRGWR